MSEITLAGLAERVAALEGKVKELEESRVVTWFLFTGLIALAVLGLVFKLKWGW